MSSGGTFQQRLSRPEQGSVIIPATSATCGKRRRNAEVRVLAGLGQLGPGEGSGARCLRGVLAPVQCPGALSSVGPGAFRVHGRACPLSEGELLWLQSCMSRWEPLAPQLLVRPLAQEPGSVLGEGRGRWRGQAARLLNSASAFPLCLPTPEAPGLRFINCFPSQRTRTSCQNPAEVTAVKFLAGALD